MKKASLAILVSLTALTGTVYAQTGDITMSTDPAKAADVEQRAQELRARQQGYSNENGAMEHQHRHGHWAGHHGHHGNHAHHRHAPKAAPAEGASQ